MTDRENMDMLAAEYVLGTLDADERAAVAARRAGDPALDRAISGWEQRLSPFGEMVDDETPRADILASIEARIEAHSDGKPSSGASDTQGGELVYLRGRLRRWRGAAVAATAIAASLAGFIVVREAVVPPHEQKFVAVFQRDDQLPSFLLSIDLGTRELTIRPVAAEGHPGKTYQLWIKADELGPAPRSLGLLEAVSGPTRKHLQAYDAKILETATFGISLEPEGGSPTGQPTSPALHGKLHPTAL